MSGPTPRERWRRSRPRRWRGWIFPADTRRSVWGRRYPSARLPRTFRHPERRWPIKRKIVREDRIGITLKVRIRFCPQQPRDGDVGGATAIALRLAINDPVTDKFLRNGSILRREMTATRNFVVVPRVRLGVENPLHFLAPSQGPPWLHRSSNSRDLAIAKHGGMASRAMRGRTSDNGAGASAIWVRPRNADHCPCLVAAKAVVSAAGISVGIGVPRRSNVVFIAQARMAPSKPKAPPIAHRSKKSFIRVLSIPSATTAWNFSATTVSGG